MLIGSQSSWNSLVSGGSLPKTGTAVSPLGLSPTTSNYLPLGTLADNLEPGSEAWKQAKLASIIEQLKQRYQADAERRGMTMSTQDLANMEKAIQDASQQIELEAAEINMRKAEAERQRQHESQLAKEARKAQESAAKYSGLAQIGGLALFGGKDGNLAKDIYKGVKSGAERVGETLSDFMAPKELPAGIDETQKLSLWEKMKYGKGGLGYPAIGALAGYGLAGGGNLTKALPGAALGYGAVRALGGSNAWGTLLGGLGGYLSTKYFNPRKPLKNWTKWLLPMAGLAGLGMLGKR